jgi:hypothetical protein
VFIFFFVRKTVEGTKHTKCNVKYSSLKSEKYYFINTFLRPLNFTRKLIKIQSNF